MLGYVIGTYIILLCSSNSLHAGNCCLDGRAVVSYSSSPARRGDKYNKLISNNKYNISPTSAFDTHTLNSFLHNIASCHRHNIIISG